MSDIPSRSRDPEYFIKIYAENADPWNFKGSEYERKKYATTMEMLEGRRFQHGLELGCSIGVLTKLLAKSCDELLAVDVVEQALSQAKIRCAELKHVTFQRMQIPVAWPDGVFDLIVLSEILYFLNSADIVRTAALAKVCLKPGGVILLVNYVRDINEPSSGDDAAEIFIQSAAPLIVQGRHLREEAFRIDVLEYPGS